MQADTTWLEDRLSGTSVTGASVYVIEVPDKAPTPYIIVWPSHGTNDSDSLAGPATERHPRFVLHAVGETYGQVALLAEAMEEELMPHGFGLVPDVQGSSCDALWYSSSTPIQRDTDTAPYLLYAVAECGWTARAL